MRLFSASRRKHLATMRKDIWLWWANAGDVLSGYQVCTLYAFVLLNIIPFTVIPFPVAFFKLNPKESRDGVFFWNMEEYF